MRTNDLKRLAPAKASSDAAALASDRVVGAATTDGLVDVALATMDSPIGELLVAVTPAGLVAIAFDDDVSRRLVERLAREVSPRVLEAAAPTDGARRELEEYFAAGRQRFDLPLDRRLIGPFAWKVLRATSRVGFGELATYGEIADRIDRPHGGPGRRPGPRFEPDPDRAPVPPDRRRERLAHRLRGRPGPQGDPPPARGLAAVRRVRLH